MRYSDHFKIPHECEHLPWSSYWWSYFSILEFYCGRGCLNCQIHLIEKLTPAGKVTSQIVSWVIIWLLLRPVVSFKSILPGLAIEPVFHFIIVLFIITKKITLSIIYIWFLSQKLTSELVMNSSNVSSRVSPCARRGTSSGNKQSWNRAR